MKSSLFLLLFISSFTLLSQNLVPNPGFDIIINCPFDGVISNAPPWNFSKNLVDASSNIPVNLYNACVAPPGPGVPVSQDGVYQPARSGDGYARVFTYGDGRDYVRDYIQAPLLEKLKSNKSYFVRFYVSPASFRADHKYFFTDAVGLGFHQGQIDNFLPMFSPPPDVSIAIQNSGIILKDTMNWIKLESCYLADGDEDYVVVGSFVTDAENLFEDENPNVWPRYALYWVEDVFVGLFDPLPDTLLLCSDDQIEFNAAFLDAKYLWNTGSTDSIIEIHQAGQYIVEAIMDNCILSDTMLVIDTQKNYSDHTDTIICQDASLVLSTPFGGQYRWSDNSSKPTLTIEQSGWYAVTVTNECGQFVFSTTVEEKDCTCYLYLANVFSPNQDGINDLLPLNISCEYPVMIDEFLVFDRWGNQVYNLQSNTEIDWDGTFNGSMLPSGVYVWQMECTINRNGIIDNYTKQGNVTIVH